MGYLRDLKNSRLPERPSSVWLKSKEKIENVATSTILGRKPVFPKKLEDELQKHLVEMEAMFYGFTKRDVCSHACQFAVRNGMPYPFKDETAGKDWFYAFMKRNPKLSVRKPMGTSFDRVRRFSEGVIDTFLEQLNELFKKHNYPPNRIFNGDETGLSVVQSKVPRVVTLKGKKQIGSLTSAERGSFVTIVLCMSTGGGFVPPVVIFPRKNMNKQLLRGAPPGTIASRHHSGWIQTHIFTK